MGYILHQSKLFGCQSKNVIGDEHYNAEKLDLALTNLKSEHISLKNHLNSSSRSVI